MIRLIILAVIRELKTKKNRRRREEGEGRKEVVQIMISMLNSRKKKLMILPKHQHNIQTNKQAKGNNTGLNHYNPSTKLHREFNIDVKRGGNRARVYI